ncbi:MAG: hypothetical protein PHO56_03935 [Patescibacteria group bacterium]|nr:hypothetical protein [Patescibacteria group bacterium]
MDTFEKKALYAQGVDFYNSKQHQEAIKCFGRLANDADAQNYIGLIRLGSGEFEMALGNFSRAEDLLSVSGFSAKEIEDRKTIFAFNRAYCHHQLGNYKKSSEILIEEMNKLLDNA